MDSDWGDTGIVMPISEGYGGTPLHYYLSRTSNVDLDIVKRLLVNSDILMSADQGNFSPIHILMNNKRIGDMFDVVKYLAESKPSSLLVKDEYGQTPLHFACSNGYITARTVQILLQNCPESIHQRNDFGCLPIHSLCQCGFHSEERKMDDEVAIDILKLLLEANPGSVSETGDEGNLPLHLAAYNKSLAFCKILVDAYPESGRRTSGDGSLPFHNACFGGRPDTVEYLFRLYPESLHIRTNSGRLPIHNAARNPNKNTSAIIEFLLRHDPECISKTIVSDDRGSSSFQGNGALPLHIVCFTSNKDNSTELLYDLYPEAILIRNGQGQLPVDVMREKLDHLSSSQFRIFQDASDCKQRIQDLIPFLYTQMSYATMAQNESGMRTRDRTGSLPLHNAIRFRAPLGSIKLLVKGNPGAVNVADSSGMHPLDLACQFSTVGVVKYLAELSLDHLNACDVNKNYSLHHACRGGNCKVIHHLLETQMSSVPVSERNVDGMLPIHLFCKFVDEHEEEEKDTEYTETIWRLLTAYPETVLNW